MSRDSNGQQTDKRHSSAAAFEVRHEQKKDEGAGAVFTRRCGRRAPADKSPCMYPFGHDGRHSWEAVEAP